MTFRTCVLLLGSLLPAVFVSCSGNGGGGAGAGVDGGQDTDGGGLRSDGGFPPAEPTDPCRTAGYYFDGESDCDVVRCPELKCECPSTVTVPLGMAPPPPEAVTLHACVRGQGCLNLLDCTRICDPAVRLTRDACEERLASAGGAACTTDADCMTGHCRAESIGKVCADDLHCAEDGHCGAGFLCRLDPASLDSKTGLRTSLGTCSDGASGSVCYQDAHCKYGACNGNRCVGGRDNDPCKLNDNCASGFCRISNPSDGTGSCVSGKPGGSCTDDGDCGSGLHCSGGVCFTSAVGQNCDLDAECASGVCISNLCRGGEPGSLCEVDADCKAGVCAASYCTSGGLLAPCYDATDCKAPLRCARQVCVDGSVGSPCSLDTDCAVRACVRSACSAGENGDRCDAPDDCKSNRCADPAGVEPGECTSGAKGSHCLYNTDCVSGVCSTKGTCN